MPIFSRRAFSAMLAGSAAGAFVPRMAAQSCAPPPGGTPVAFTPIAGLANIKRKAASALTPAEIARLRLAYQRLRALTVSDPTDPRGWMQQANVHCWQCGGSGTDIHNSWFFLPWHRAFLYFHERILCKLLNDNTFRLPYWDWDSSISRSLPAAYRPAMAGTAANPLFDADRSTNASGGASLPASVFPSATNPMNAANFAAFGGSAGSGGGLEFGPHGRIHVWAGGPTGIDMGLLDSAARDPVFYAHHCEIDRLWAEWVRRNPVAHANPTSAAFLSKSFLFFDENKKWTRIRVRDVLNTVPLGFSYTPGAALSKSTNASWTELSYDAGSSRVKLPEEDRARLTAATDLAKPRTLVVEDAVLPTASGLYNVFVGDPPAGGGDPAAAPNYLGYMGVILSSHQHERKSTLVLASTTAFLTQAAGQGAILMFAESTSGQATRLAYSNVYITEE